MTKEITPTMRMNAATDVAEKLDRAVRQASAYGQANVAAFDLVMALTGVSQAMAVWGQHGTDEQFAEWLKYLINGTWASRQEIQLLKAPAPAVTADPAVTSH